MNGREHPWCELRGQHLAPLPGDSESRSENGLRRCRTHCHDEVGPNDPQFRFQPGTARCDFARVRLLMNSAFSAGLPLKMFHRVGHVNLRSIDSSVRERAIHNFPSWTNEWSARDIFVIARLFANQHHRCALRTFAKDSLGSAFVQMTRSAVSCCFAHGGQT
jgi:hypothetical protein